MQKKIRTKQKQFQMNKKAFIFITVLCMGIGFAFLTSNLTITGNTSVSGNSWNVYFTNIQETDGSVEPTVVPTTSGTTTTSLNYTVTLDKPGDFYEFTVDVVNDGTIDAMIESIDMNNLDTDVEKYLSYTATYKYGSPIRQNDVLQKKSMATYKVRVAYKTDIEAEDLDEEGINLTLTFGVNYTQSTVVSEFAKLVKKNVLSDTSLDFTQISSDSNGKGLYLMNSTKNNSYPIYYYRGNVSNNNAKFAGFCWKIVRTTDTGGTKLIYNGTPDENGQCTNTTGDATQLENTSTFHERGGSPAYVGYMYGTSYEENTQPVSTSDVYGNTVIYENGTYTLSDTQNGVDSTHHYTCFSSDISCTSVFYVNYEVASTAYYITLTNGKKIEDAFREMYTNSNDSNIKTVVDTWFNETLKSYFTNLNKKYDDYLEDTIWCNDRNVYRYGTWNPNGGSLYNSLDYSSNERISSGQPRVNCPNKIDSFTVQESATGNGALDFPVGLLTIDEIILAGGNYDEYDPLSNNFYLNTNKVWWTMSPSNYYLHSSRNFFIISDGSVARDGVFVSAGVRPSISLKPTVKIAAGGDGTAATPYEFVVE